MLLCDLTPPLKGIVILTGLDQTGKVVYQIAIDDIDYYHGRMHKILDEDTRFRKNIGVRSVVGQIWNSHGNLDQTFTNTYDEEGTYIERQIICN